MTASPLLSEWGGTPSPESLIPHLFRRLLVTLNGINDCRLSDLPKN
jgi:hypothetical protein